MRHDAIVLGVHGGRIKNGISPRRFSDFLRAHASRQATHGTQRTRMARAGRPELDKAIVAPAVALFFAVVSWVLTSREDATRLDVARQRGAADVEIAPIDAVRGHMELVRILPVADAGQRRQAVAIAAPARPRELAFRPAIDPRADDPAPLDVLMPKPEAFTYLARRLEVPCSPVKQVLHPSPASGAFAKQPSDGEPRASTPLRHLPERGQPTPLLEQLVSSRHGNEPLRATGLPLHIEECRPWLRDAAGHLVQQASERARTEGEFRCYVPAPSLTGKAEHAIAVTSAMPHQQAGRAAASRA